MKKKNIKILILEDDLETVVRMLNVLREIEDEKDVYFGFTVLSTHREVENYINKNKAEDYDILLLDRDDYAGGSYHVIDLSLFNIDNAVTISSVPEYNKHAEEKGIKRVVYKDYRKLKSFSDGLRIEILKIVNSESA